MTLDLENHVLELAMKQGFIVRFKGGDTKCRLMLRRIETPRIVGPTTYFTALHEIGHAAHFNSIQDDGPYLVLPTASERLAQEAEAWKWALDNAIIPPTQAVRRRIGKALASYLKPVRQRWTEPPSDHVFWELSGKNTWWIGNDRKDNG